MIEIKPGTPPAEAATLPGSNEQGKTTPSSPTPPATPGTTGNETEGKVTISTKEYADLQRAKARQLSFERRKNFAASRNNPLRKPEGNPGAPNDAIAEELSAAETRAQEAEQRALKAEVAGKVRELLDKDEFKALPKSTRDLILKNPHMLSDADNVDEALLDIEDFVREQVAGLEAPKSPAAPAPGGAQPQGHETPPTVTAGNPAPAPAAGLEDTTNLRGAALSRAVLRNSLRKARGVK